MSDATQLAAWACDAQQRSKTPNVAYFAARRQTAIGAHDIEACILLSESPDPRDRKKGRKLMQRRMGRILTNAARAGHQLGQDILHGLQLGINSAQHATHVEHKPDGTTEYTFTFLR